MERLASRGSACLGMLAIGSLRLVRLAWLVTLRICMERYGRSGKARYCLVR
nr:MAG TPA: hypothetical protein [Caudoviricetes sp.]